MKNAGGAESRRVGAKGVVFGFIVGVGLGVFLGPCSGCKTLEVLWGKVTGSASEPNTTHSEPPKAQKIVPCKEIVDDLRALWSFERNYAYHHKELAPSISKMGDGTGIGKEGFVLDPSLWEARIDDNTNAVPRTYRIENPKSGRKESVGAYRFGIVPVLTEGGEIDRFSVVLIAVPEVSSKEDACFLALCGPISFQNDFSFDKKWPVFQLNAEEEVLREFRGLKPISMGSLTQRLTGGDLKRHANRTFCGLSNPEDAK